MFCCNDNEHNGRRNSFVKWVTRCRSRSQRILFKSRVISDHCLPKHTKEDIEAQYSYSWLKGLRNKCQFQVKFPFKIFKFFKSFHHDFWCNILKSAIILRLCRRFEPTNWQQQNIVFTFDSNSLKRNLIQCLWEVFMQPNYHFKKSRQQNDFHVFIVS